MNNSSICILFIIYSFIGYVCEVIYVSFNTKRVVDRGFLYGPICPVYGFGGLLVIFLLKPVSNTIFPLFLSAVFVTSLLEYFTGWILEILFDTKWWDYSEKKLNLHGRVCLLNSVLFGIMSLIAVHFIHPFLLSFVLNLSDFNSNIIASVLLGILLLDILFSLKKIMSLNEHLLLLGEFTESLKDKFANEAWFNAGSIQEMFETVLERDKGDKEGLKIPSALVEKIHGFSLRTKKLHRFIKKFPSISSVRHKISLEDIKKRFDHYIKNR